MSKSRNYKKFLILTSRRLCKKGEKKMHELWEWAMQDGDEE